MPLPGRRLGKQGEPRKAQRRAPVPFLGCVVWVGGWVWVWVWVWVCVRFGGGRGGGGEDGGLFIVITDRDLGKRVPVPYRWRVAAHLVLIPKNETGENGTLILSLENVRMHSGRCCHLGAAAEHVFSPSLQVFSRTHTRVLLRGRFCDFACIVPFSSFAPIGSSCATAGGFREEVHLRDERVLQ